MSSDLSVEQARELYDRKLREICTDEEWAVFRRRLHVVTRVNDYYYVCDECGQAGSERWAILHQYPAT